MTPVIRVARVGAIEVPLPAYQTEGSVGLDLRAAIAAPIVIDPGARKLVPTGLAMAIPAGYEGQVRPRSGLAWKHGITVLNTPGTIDQDYRGEIQICLANLGAEPFRLEPLERVAQLVVAPVARASFDLVDRLDETERGAGGYGSTGRS